MHQQVPAPGNNETGVLLTPTLSWSGGDPDTDNTLTYDVYFGLEGARTLVSSGQVAATYLPGALQLAATYEWRWLPGIITAVLTFR